MSIEIVQQVKEGIALESNVTGHMGLGFPAHIAKLMATKYKAAVKNDPIAQGIKTRAVFGRPDQFAIMLGIQSMFDVEFRVYPLGTSEEGTAIELWVAEDAEGNTLIAYNTEEVRVENQLEDENAVMSVFGFEAGDLDKVLEALATDLSDKPSIEDEE